MAKDYYTVLGVEKGASIDEIKRAYRKLAMQHHPDRNKGDKSAETKFKEITSAYEVLSDPQKKQQYDTYGTADSHQSGGFSDQQGGGFDFSGFGGGQGFGGIEDIFETFFAGGTKSRRSNTSSGEGEDVHVRLKLSFEQAAFGSEQEITVSHQVVCHNCQGSGLADGGKMVGCSDCGGTGEKIHLQRSFLGQIRTQVICETCRGRGKQPDKPCHHCHGEGRTLATEKVAVQIPAGVDDGMTVRVRGKGNVGVRSTTAGDLNISISVTPSNLYEREGADIHSALTITPPQAVLGDEVAIDTLYGKKTLVIPKGTQHKDTIRLKEHGIVRVNSYNKGDHYIHITIHTPKKLSKQEEKLYKELLTLQR